MPPPNDSSNATTQESVRKVTRALLSVSDKAGLVELAKDLNCLGVELVASGGTANAIRDAGLPVLDVAELTASPEMLGGRVKTLHPKIHGGILARRDLAEDQADLEANAIRELDLVVCNLYPFEATVAQAGVTRSEAVEKIDIGGPSMIRSAAKNHAYVGVVCDPTDYQAIVTELREAGGLCAATRRRLALKAFQHTASYDAAISQWLGENDPEIEAELFPDALIISLEKADELRYGENPHQTAAWYTDETEVGLGGAAVLQGKELSYTNLLDLDAAARIALEFDEPAAVVIKHTNPCGVATGSTTASAYINAREADSQSAFGGIVGLNRAVDIKTAEALISTFIEAVIAPVIDEDARPILAKKSKMRVITADFNAFAGDAGIEVRSILGATLVQARDQVTEALSSWPDDALRVVTQRKPTPEEWRALRFAWRICAHVKSNTVIFTGADQTLAIGAGQMSRVDAVNVAKMKVGSGVLKGSVAASDAFFPFRDGLDAINAAGATAVIQPGGSVRDAEVIAAADEHEIAMVFTARRHFRH